MHSTTVPSDRGAIAIWTLGLVLATYLALAILVDLGGAMTAKAATLGAAQQAARAGAGPLDLAPQRLSGDVTLEPDAARSAAGDFLARSGYTGSVTATRAEVRVTAVTRRRTALLRVTGLDTLTLTATAGAEPSTG